MARTALRVAFGIIWVVNAGFAWTGQFAIDYVGYLRNAAQGQPAWSAFWFNTWIALVTPRAGLFIWLTRIIATALAAALVLGIARKSLYFAGALFSLLVWSTAEGFGGPYAVGAANMGTGIVYVLLFIALIAINSSSGPSPYSLDYYIEMRWPWWRRIAESRGATLTHPAHPISWRLQAPALAGIAVLVILLLLGLHSSLNVEAPSPQAAAAAVSPLSLAASTPIAAPRDARLPPLLGTGNSVSIHLVVTNDNIAIASGVDYQAWTYGGTVPGPILHVRQGQTVNVTLTNHGTMQHSIDFHAAQTRPNLHYVDIQPGKSLQFSFVADVPGAFIYHCETQPILLHVANGMYGVMVVDPKKPLPPAAESFVIEQSEWYTQQVSGRLVGPDYQKMLAERPDEVVFNGVAFQYREHPLVATAGKRIRIYFVDAGPNLWTSFHVIGSIFDKVYPDEDAAHALSDVSTYTVGPGAGAIFDLIIPKPGGYAFVDHDMAHLMIGAVGILDVRTGGTSASEVAPATPPGVATPAVSAVPPPAPPGPYHFNAANGKTLFTTNCAACHQATGEGIPGAFPTLKGNAVVLDSDPVKQIDVVLHGLHGENAGGTVYATPMPPFGKTLNDAEIADIINYVRSSWGNHAKLITANQVNAMRPKRKAK